MVQYSVIQSENRKSKIEVPNWSSKNSNWRTERPSLESGGLRKWTSNTERGGQVQLVAREGLWMTLRQQNFWVGSHGDSVLLVALVYAPYPWKVTNLEIVYIVATEVSDSEYFLMISVYSGHRSFRQWVFSHDMLWYTWEKKLRGSTAWLFPQATGLNSRIYML